MKQLQATELKRFNRDWRREHPPAKDLALVLQSVSYPANVGSLFRIADGVKVQKMFLCGSTPTPDHPTVIKVGRNKHQRIDWVYQQQPEDAITQLKSEGYHICALELTDESAPYFTAAYPDKLCLVLGNEDHGISKSVLALCDSAVFVPMYGKGLSLNVHVSAAVVLYHMQQEKK